MDFDIKQTHIAKGVAVLLLIWHHLFFNRPDIYVRFTSIYIFQGVPVECWIASFSKVCVAIFLLLSGYGMYKSYNKKIGVDKVGCLCKKEFVFVSNHILKQLFNFWFIFVIFVPIGFFFGRNISEIYAGNLFWGLIDFSGFSSLFSTPTANVTWWFINLIILLYLFFPILIRFIKWSAEWFIMLFFLILTIPKSTSIPIIGEYLVWIPPFVMGMILAKYNLLERIYKNNQGFIKGGLLSCTSIIFFAVVRIWLKAIGVHTATFDSFFALSIVLFCYTVISRIPFLSYVLEIIGKFSGDIYMFHFFITEYYLREQLYWFRYSIIIFVVSVVICFIIAWVLDIFKRLTRYNDLVKKLARYE